MGIYNGPVNIRQERHFFGERRNGHNVCRYWQEGRCNRGDECKWLHLDVTGPRGFNHVDERNDDPNSFSDRSYADHVYVTGAKRIESGGEWEETYRDNVGAGIPVSNVWKGLINKICRFWLVGNCKKKNCRHLHAHTANAEINLIKELEGHTKTVRAIELRPDSSYLMSAGLDQSVRIWDCITGECRNVVHIGGDIQAMLSVGTWLFVGGGNEVKILDMDMHVVHSLTGPQGVVHSLVTVGPNMLFAGVQDGSILAWKFNTFSNLFEPEASLLGHNGAVVTLMAQETQLFSGSIDNDIKVWNLTTYQCFQTLKGHTHAVMRLVMWEKFLLSCSLDGTIRVWASHSEGGYEAYYTHPEENDGDVELMGALAMCGTVDSHGKPVLIVAYNDNRVELYDLPSFSIRGTIYTRNEVQAMLVGPNGLLFSGEGEGAVKVWQFGEFLSNSHLVGVSMEE